MNQSLVVKEDMSLMELGKVLSASGYFNDVKDVAQAVVKVLAGREMGFGPIASMTGIYIVKGKPIMGANLIAAAVKRSGKYDYRVKVHTAEECTIEFYERADGKRELIGVSTFKIEDARKAGTQNLDKFPRNMLFARAMSNGAKWYCADVFGGPVYTPEELGATVDEEGEVIEHGPSWSVVTTGHPPIEQLPKVEEVKAENIGQPIETAMRDPEEDAIFGSPATYEVPAPAPQPVERKVFRIASVKFNGMTPDQWHTLADKFAASHQNWQKNGKTDMQHILVSAGRAGYADITSENIDEVLTAIVAAHEGKAQA